jgi:DNA-binding winged helix-turn-helix (wHTH) protein
VLNVASRQLLRGGGAVALEPKMFALLELLLERRPAVVTYDEIDERLWPKVYVARTSLTRLVSELRTLLGDSPADSRIIRTAYKTGYAFAAKVTQLGNSQLGHSQLDHSQLGNSQLAASVFSLLWNDRVLPLVEGENIAGRGADCSVVVDATTVSRRHARFVVSSGGVTVEDLASTNGTFVNKVAISSKCPLEADDEIALGKASLRLRILSPLAPTEAFTHDLANRRRRP